MDMDISSKIAVAIFALIALFLMVCFSSWLVMLLWNWIIPVLVPGGQLAGNITFWQAWGVTMLSSCLFKSVNMSSNSKD
jgi:hypothetical protein